LFIRGRVGCFGVGRLIVAVAVAVFLSLALGSRSVRLILFICLGVAREGFPSLFFIALDRGTQLGPSCIVREISADNDRLLFRYGTRRQVGKVVWVGKDAELVVL